MEGMVRSAATAFSHLEWRHRPAAAPAPSHYTGSCCPTAAPPLQPPGMAAPLLCSPHFQRPGGEALPSCSPRSQPLHGEAPLHCISPAAATWNGGTASASQQPPFPATWGGGTAHLQLLATTMRGAAPLQLSYCSHMEWRHCFSAAPFSIEGRHCPPASPAPSHHKGRRCSTVALLLQPNGMEALLCSSAHFQLPGGMLCSAVALISTSHSPHLDWALPSPTSAEPLDSKDLVQQPDHGGKSPARRQHESRGNWASASVCLTTNNPLHNVEEATGICTPFPTKPDPAQLQLQLPASSETFVPASPNSSS